MNTKSLPQVGDVISSPKFAFGYYEGEQKECVTVDGVTTTRVVEFFLDGDERARISAETGKPAPRKREVELGAPDATRAEAKFVVVVACMTGGNGDYQDGWHVTARRLNADGTYNPEGEVICFYMTGCFTCMVYAADIKVVGKMKMMFV